MTLIVVLAAIAALLVFILLFKLPAYLALLLVSLLTGLALGMPADQVLASIQSGMGGTLGFVAVVVGLGALLGAMLEYSGGVQVIAHGLLKRGGTEKAPWLLSILGFIVAIPVFFDVAFIILVPMLYSLARDSKISVQYYAMPVLAGLLVAHAFVPPTPGPIAVAELLQAELGLVILFGLIVGIPAIILAGPVYARRFRQLPLEDFLKSENFAPTDTPQNQHFGFAKTLSLIVLPLVLILSATAGEQLLPPSALLSLLSFLGHPFTALSLSTLLAWVLLRGSGVSGTRLETVLGKALEPAGVVVLVTGAGGVFKQILTDSGAGVILADAVTAVSSLPVVFGFVVALLVRVSQGSATVAMITAAGLLAPVQQNLGLGAVDTALLVIAIAAGASSFSHVNDSGFWLVSRYLRLDTKATLASWTLMSGLAGLVGFAMTLLLSVLL